MDEDIGVRVTRLRRRLSVESEESTKSPSAPSTPTKKKTTRLAAKPALEHIEEDANENVPKNTTRKSVAKDVGDIAEDKALTPSRRSARIKSNKSLLADTTITDSPRAKRAARRNSQIGSDTETPVAPVRQTRRTRKNSTTNIDSQANSTENTSDNVVVYVVSQENEPIPEETVLSALDNNKNESQNKSPRKSVNGTDSNEPNNLPSEAVTETMETTNNITPEKTGQTETDNSYKLNESSINLLNQMNQGNTKLNVILNKSTSDIDKLKEKKVTNQRTKSWTTLSDSMLQNDNVDTVTKLDKSASGDKIDLNNSNKLDMNKSIALNTSEDKENTLYPNRDEVMDTAKILEQCPDKNVQPFVMIEDTDSNSEKLSIDIPESEDQCVPVVENPATETPHKNSVEPMDIDESIPNVTIDDYSDKANSSKEEEQVPNSEISSNNAEKLNTSKQTSFSLQLESINEAPQVNTDEVDNPKANKSDRKSSILQNESIHTNQQENDNNKQEIENKENRKSLSNTDHEHKDNLNTSKRQSLVESKDKSSINQDECVNEVNTSKSKKKSLPNTETENLEQSNNENKSTLVLSQLKDVSANEAKNVSNCPNDTNNDLSKSINAPDLNNKNKNLAKYSTSTPLQQKSSKKMGLPINTSIISPHVSKKTPNRNNSDSEDSSDEDSKVKDKSKIIDDEASEASDDYESGDSRDEDEKQYEIENEIVEKGETLDSEEEFSNDSEYDKDSFIVSSDAEDEELLSGTGDDLSLSDNELKMTAKSKKKFDDRKRKQQKKASKEMYEARHLNDSDKSSKSKHKRQRIDSSRLDSDDDKPKKSNRLRIDSSQDDSKDESVQTKKKRVRRLSESICEENDVSKPELEEFTGKQNTKNSSKIVSDTMDACNESVNKSKSKRISVSKGNVSKSELGDLTGKKSKLSESVSEDNKKDESMTKNKSKRMSKSVCEDNDVSKSEVGESFTGKKKTKLASVSDENSQEKDITDTFEKSVNKSKHMSESVSEENYIENEKEITIFNNSTYKKDPLSVSIKQEPKTPQKDLDISTVPIVDNIEEVQVNTNTSVFQQNETSDPLQATMDQDDDSSSKDSDNMEIMQNYDSVLDNLNKQNRNKAKTLNSSLNLNKKANETKNDPIIDQLNLTQAKKVKNKNKFEENKIESIDSFNDDSETSDSIDMKLLFPENSNDSDSNTSKKQNNEETESFIPLKKTEAKTHLPVSLNTSDIKNESLNTSKKKNKKSLTQSIGNEDNELNNEIKMFIDTSGTHDLNSSQIDVTNSSKKKKKNKNNVTLNEINEEPESSEEQKQITTEIENIEEPANVSNKKKKKNKNKTLDLQTDSELLSNRKQSKQLSVSLTDLTSKNETPLEVLFASEKKKKKNIDISIVNEQIVQAVECHVGKKLTKTASENDGTSNDIVEVETDISSNSEKKKKKKNKNLDTSHVEPNPDNSEQKKSKHKSVNLTDNVPNTDENIQDPPDEEVKSDKKKKKKKHDQTSSNDEQNIQPESYKKPKKSSESAHNEDENIQDPPADEVKSDKKKKKKKHDKNSSNDEQNIQPDIHKKSKKKHATADGDDDSDDAPMEMSYKCEKRLEGSDLLVSTVPEDMMPASTEKNKFKKNKKKKKKAASEDTDENASLKKRKLDEEDTGLTIQPNVLNKKRKIFPDNEEQTVIKDKKSKKRKERDDDGLSNKSKVSKQNSLDDIHVPRLPESVLSQLDDKPQKTSSIKTKKVIATSQFIVEDAPTRKNKPSNYLEQSVYLNDSPKKEQKKSKKKNPKVLPFLPTVATSESGYTSEFRINVLPKETEFVAQAANVVNFKNNMLHNQRIKKLGTLERYKQQRTHKLAKF